MIYSNLIHKAITFGIKIHEIDVKKKRKGKDIPYITHSLTVALILSQVTKNENIIVAALLHDTIEDCEPYGSVTKELLAKEFNPEVARMVNDVTEQDKNLPWVERKLAALNHIKDMKQDSILIKSADVLHNLTDLNDDIENDGVEVFNKFNATMEQTVDRYIKLLKEFERVWPENPLLVDLRNAQGKLMKCSLR